MFCIDMKSIRLVTCILFLVLLAGMTSSVMSQCSMCRATAESGLKSNEKKTGQGLNKGILYLLSIPYLMGGVAFLVWYRHRKKQ